MNILSLYIGYITDLIIGDPYSFPHPVKYIGKLIKSVENFIRKIAKSDKGLKIGGFFLWFVTVGITFIITYEIIRLARFNMVVYVIINSIVIYTTLATKCLKDEAKKIYVADMGYKKVMILDYDTGKVLDYINIDGDPLGIQISNDYKLLFISDTKNNLIKVYNTSDNTLIKNIEVGKEPTTILCM